MTTALNPEGKQTDLLIDHFKRVGTVSGLEATALYKITSLTKVISVLRKLGFNITSEWKRDNTGKRYKRYFGSGRQPQGIA